MVSLAIASISGWFAWKTSQDLPSLAQSVSQDDKKASEASMALTELEALPVAKATLQPMDAAFSNFMLQLMNSRVRFGIELGQVTPSKPGTAERTPIGELADDVPGTSVKALKVELQGTYADYERFVQFLDYVRQVGMVSIIHLRVKDNAYALSVRVYGKS